MARFDWEGSVLRTPTAIATAYLVFGVAWILVSDWAVTWLFGLSALTALAQLAKGLLFVGGSCVVIYWLVLRRDRYIEEREATIEADRLEIESLRSEVEESERLMRTILGNINETVLLTDEDGRLTYVCPNVNFIFGYSAEEVRQMGTVQALVGQEFPPGDLDAWDIIQNVEHEVVDAAGETHTVLVTVKSVDVEAGSVLYSIRDITDRKSQEERFRAYVENSSDVFTVLDRDHEVKYVSPAVEHVFGYDMEGLVGRDAFEMIHPEDREQVLEVFEEITDRPPGTTISVQYRTRHADGSWVWSESRLTTPEHDAVAEFVVNTRDVSDLREREGRLSVLDRVLRHNLRNKLNIVMGAAMDIRDQLDPQGQEQLDHVVAATEDLLRLSEKARRFDTAIRGVGLDAEPVDLVATARRVVEEKRIEYPDVEFRTRFPEEAWVSAHEAIELAIAELIDNAVVHSEKEAPTIEIEVEVEEGTTSVAVADFGPGIPEMDRQAVVRGEETPLEHGMNIGLWLVRWTMDNSDGTLAVHDNEPTGTRVEARLPSVEPAPAD